MIHELRHIRAFLKIAETRNFTRAANDMHLSQSALTVQVQQLEESLGVRLFDRNKRGVTLTAAGKDVFGPLQRLFNDAQTIVEHARDLSSASTGFVTIAALPTVCAGALPELVRSFSETYPGIRVQISDVVAERVREAVLKREVDFGIGTLLRARCRPSLNSPVSGSPGCLCSLGPPALHEAHHHASRGIHPWVDPAKTGKQRARGRGGHCTSRTVAPGHSP